MFSRLVCWCIYKNKNPRYLDYSEVCLAQLLQQFDRCDFRREIFYVCDAFTVQSSVGLWSYPASNVLKEKTVSIVHRNRDIAHPPKGLDGTKQLPYQPSVRNRFACFLCRWFLASITHCMLWWICPQHAWAVLKKQVFLPICLWHMVCQGPGSL